MSEVTQLLTAAEQGDSAAAERLLPLVYDELRRLAAQKLAQEAPGQTLQATALVHEAYLRLIGDPDRRWDGARHFFLAAAQAMRRILIDNARRKQAARHGGGWRRVDVDQVQIATKMLPDELLLVDEALEGLRAADPEAAELIQLRFYSGLDHQQAAEALGITRRAADRLYAFARAWLFRELRGQDSDNGLHPPAHGERPYPRGHT